ncbi:hypothetical protein SEPL_065 [Salmonella phage SE_PL]|uniref:hypothetical protein n=1 Tax=Salmonella enterica TaxID=28901 RepID=UPI0011620302|nr:hypothetical protein [Salmonella enterica subsp. enterica serovar Infantis]EME3782818.1 hypothetical protein [Salmonella enterica]QCW19060.1 hypothetical protein 7t3_0540 [Salmonella phage 7t3]QIG62678.1 hypothetical protein SEPL_065 [Salmonella phage SE_PL]WNV47469.1 hypothetical protein [Klebsiella phage fENko-Kae01]
MTAKIEFFYTHGHHYTASGVIDDSIVTDGDILSYSSTIEKENLDIRTIGVTEVKMKDLKFAIVTYSAGSMYEGCTQIIHGLVEKFDIMATFTEAEKIRKLEESEREAEERAQYRRQREAEKYVERRKKRAAERKAERTKNGASN